MLDNADQETGARADSSLDSARKMAEELRASLEAVEADDIEDPRAEVMPVNEVLRDGTVGWHALRGYNFAGLASVLEDGLKPSLNGGGERIEQVVCLSASPRISSENNRLSNSFYEYSLKKGISLGVKFSGNRGAIRSYGGFEDEIRESTGVDPQRIKYILIPEADLKRPLLDLPAGLHEQRKPEAVIGHIETTRQHLKQLGYDDLAESFQEAAKLYIEQSREGNHLSRAETDSLERLVIDQYRVALTNGSAEPTLEDALNMVIGGRSDIRIVTFDEQLKADIARQNRTLFETRPMRPDEDGFYDDYLDSDGLD
jgi:hypothetical protein